MRKSATYPKPPRTRFQGSKWKLLDWIASHLGPLDFGSALDAFGGTGSVSYLLKQMGIAVTYNDSLRFNHDIGTALIENDGTRLTDPVIDSLVVRDPGFDGYDDFIGRTFTDIYYTDDEHKWLDTVVANIDRMDDRFARAVARFSLYQAALVKRPYNLFHRKNLYLRTADVERSFGNKVTWDRPFETHFRKFVAEANAAIFQGEQRCVAVRGDVIRTDGDFDLVYLDPPYVAATGSRVDYHHFYHFLEGLADYRSWRDRVDYSTKHRRTKPIRNPWTSPKGIQGAFDSAFAKFADSIIVVSYRSDGIPSIEELVSGLRRVKSEVAVHVRGRYQYALSTNRDSKEVLIIAR
jgi:adenine-specific DNA-methyltransferase